MQKPYLTPAAPSIRIIPLLTVPEAAPNGYRLAGVPDGIGAHLTGESCFDLLITHELRYNQGGRRKHAASGAFVSRWRFDLNNWNGGDGWLTLLEGEDLIQEVHFWDHATESHKKGPLVPLERLCSADLPEISATYVEDAEGNAFGTKERLFLGGEETHTRYKPVFGRAFAHVVTGHDEGKSWELPKLGKGSWENALLCPTPQRKTIAILPDDATVNTSATWDLRNPASEIYVYVGSKEPANSEAADFAKAGLHNGTLYGIQVYLEESGESILAEDDELGFGGDHNGGQRLNEARFRLVDLGDRSKDDPQDLPGTALQKDSLAKEITRFLRPEDGAWDPRHEEFPGHFWVVTTGDEENNSRVFHLVFDDISEPEKGGKITIEATGRTEGDWQFSQLDSVGIDRLGRVFLQEDPGKASKRSRTLLLGENGMLRTIAEAAEEFFDSSGEHFITTNEESAGIVPADDILGQGWFFTAVQCNDTGSWREEMRPTGMTDGDWEELKQHLVTPGQVLAIFVPPSFE